MSTQDAVTAWLLERGRSPLEAVFIPVADDLFDAFPGQFTVRQSEWDAGKAERAALELERLDDRLKSYLDAMPPDLRARLKTLIDQRTRREVEKAHGQA